jgi:ribonuclease HII
MDVRFTQLIAGVDEAGRGPLAGPVVAGAVILNPAKFIDGLRDSKKLSEKKREALCQLIQANALSWGLGIATVAEIDSINILQASLLAMQRAVAALAIQPKMALIDGNICPKLACPSQALIRGDDISPAISAASIIAKVTRDRLMQVLDLEHPGYGFAQHKGYGTVMHLEALITLGPSAVHRMSFAPVAKSRR